MNVLDIFTLIGGLCLFLFGMNIMGEALERKAGGELRNVMGKLTSHKAMGFLTGLGVTAVIQSSSATTVMTVGFVNSGLMTLGQSIMVIMGANIGTTVTAWMLSLVGLQGGSLAADLLNPACFSPVLALIGVIFYVFLKSEKRRDVGLILLGFSTLMFGMETMSGAVSGLCEVPGFSNLFLIFTNPLLGMLVGAAVTAIIQSSSASTGILQALAATGQITLGAAVPLIIGQNIGTCGTTLLSCVGATKNAKRTALVHLCFNVIGATVCLAVYSVIMAVFRPVMLDQTATAVTIAAIHSLFNVFCTLLMLPLTGFLEKLVIKLIPDGKKEEAAPELDELLFASPSIALQRGHDVTSDMAICTALSVREAMSAVDAWQPQEAAAVEARVERVEQYRSQISQYLVRLSTCRQATAYGSEVASMLKVTGELHYIALQSAQVLDAARRLAEEKQELPPRVRDELWVMWSAIKEMMRRTLSALTGADPSAVEAAAALTRLICEHKQEISARNILRLQSSECSVKAGVVWMDLLTALERIGLHYGNIAAALLQEQSIAQGKPYSISRETVKGQYEAFRETYSLPPQ